MRKGIFAAPYALWMVLFTVFPMLFVVYYAFTTSGGSFTLENLKSVSDPSYLKATYLSLKLSVECTLVCLFVGYPAAYFLASQDFSRHRMIFILILLPMWMNFLLRTYAMLSLLERRGVISGILGSLGFENVQLNVLGTNGAVLLGMVYNFLPFMILPIHTALKKMDQRVVEAALDLGASPRRVFTRVTLPLSLPGVVSGITMVFMPSVTTFAISRLLGEGNTRLIGDLIEDKFLRSTTNTVVNGWGVGSTLSLFMLILIVISIWLLNRIDPKREGA